MKATVSTTKLKTVCPNFSAKSSGTGKKITRILAIFFHPDVSVTAIGGAEKRFVETLKFFCKNAEFEVFVLEPPPSLLMKLEGRCIKQLVLPVFMGSGWLSNYVFWVLWAFKAAIKSLSIAKKVKPNAIFVPNNTFPNILSGFVASFFTRLPLSVVVHHFDVPFSVSDVNGGCSLYGCYRNVGYGRLVALFKAFSFYVSVALLERAKVIVAVSNFTANVVRNCGIVDARIFVSGNAADVGFIDSVKPLSAVKVYDGVFVGRIAKEKGVFDLVEAWKKVVRVKANAKLLIIGSGIELEALKKEVSLSNLENNVLVIGRCEEVELYRFLKHSRVFVFPSVFEGWGISVAEALACGLPVVAYNIPALREIFGECESVFLVPVKDVACLASTILSVLKKSEKEYEKLSYCSRSYSKRFCWEKVALRDMEIIKTLKYA